MSLRLRIARAKGRCPRRTTTFDDIATTLGEILGQDGHDIFDGSYLVGIREDLDGWGASAHPRAVRAQVAVWRFAPDGRLVPCNTGHRLDWESVVTDPRDYLDRWG